jgi:hypothetical protein
MFKSIQWTADYFFHARLLTFTHFDIIVENHSNSYHWLLQRPPRLNPRPLARCLELTRKIKFFCPGREPFPIVKQQNKKLAGTRSTSFGCEKQTYQNQRIDAMYSHVRYIGYDISTVATLFKVKPPTSTSDVETVYAIPAGKMKNPPRLYGLKDENAKISADAKVRIQRLIGVMLKAAQYLSPTDSSKTLKVFVAPEFYFRPTNPELAYTMDEYRRIKSVLRSTIDNYRALIDWLIVPGTIMWIMDKSDAGKSQREIDPKSTKVIYFNTSLYIKRYSNPFKSAQSKVIEKYEASHIDGLPLDKSAPKEYPEYQSPAKIQKHLFTLDGVKFGLEICLEHGYGAPDPSKKYPGYSVRILKTFIAGNADSVYADGVDLHLLTAGGMPLNPESVVSKTNGYIFRADGYVNPAKPATEIKRITAYTGTKKPNNLTSAAQLADLSPKFGKIDIDSKDDLYLQPPAGCEDYWRPQKIHISERYKLP